MTIRKDDHLIAAGPALLDALLALRDYTNDGGCWCNAFGRGRKEHSSECKKARAAITLAQPEEDRA